MKHLLHTIFLLTLAAVGSAHAQCTNVTLNWDNLAYVYNGGNYASYTSAGVACGVTTAMMQTQNFAIGSNRLTITSNYTSTNTLGNTTAHTGEGSSFGNGEDIQFRGNGSLTLSFASAVDNPTFSLYDIDNSKIVTVTATNGGSPKLITMTTVTSTILTVTGNNTATAVATANVNRAALTSTDGTVNVSISGPVTGITISVTGTGTGCTSSCGSAGTEDGSFYLSDIQACVTSSFATDYYNHVNARPYTGQPSYILAAHDLNTVYMVDPATGVATSLFTDPHVREINDLAYDARTRILYYGVDGVERKSPAGLPDTVKYMKKYDFNTEVVETGYFISNISNAPLNVPTFRYGLESGGAAFYDGALYLGVEGNGTGSTGRKSIIYRIDVDGSGNATRATQVFAQSAATHDWGDFLLKDGVLYNFNGLASTPRYQTFNMRTGSLTTYTLTNAWDIPRQGAITWDGQLKWIGDSIANYNGTNVVGTRTPITTAPGSVTWVSRAGDAAEAFRPKMDFGDAPASYDPVTGDPAVHELRTSLYLGTGVDREFSTRGQVSAANSDNLDDGLAYVTTYNPGSGSYLTQVSVFNNTGSAATVCAWLDHNGNGVFDVSEGITVSVPSSASAQSVYLYWSGLPNTLTLGTYTYLRIRLAASGLTTSNPTGWIGTGEVEDYRVPVNAYPLATQVLQFQAQRSGKKVNLQWEATEGANLKSYIIQRSADGRNWTNLSIQPKEGPVTGVCRRRFTDVQPGIRNYYRIQLFYQGADIRISETRAVHFESGFDMQLQPNPARELTTVTVFSDSRSDVELRVVNTSGMLLYSRMLTLTEGANAVALPVEGWSAGTYLVRLHSKGKEAVLVKKLVVQ